MPYKHSRKEEFVHIAWHGELTNEDLVAVGRELPKLAAELGYAPHVLHTFDEVTGANVEPWTVFEHSLRHRDVPLRNRAKAAWVVRTPEMRRMGELFQELNRNPNFEIRLFNSETAALRWLRSTTVRKRRIKSREAAG